MGWGGAGRDGTGRRGRGRTPLGEKRTDRYTESLGTRPRPTFINNLSRVIDDPLPTVAEQAQHAQQAPRKLGQMGASADLRMGELARCPGPPTPLRRGPRVYGGGAAGRRLPISSTTS